MSCHATELVKALMRSANRTLALRKVHGYGFSTMGLLPCLKVHWLEGIWHSPLL